MGVRVENPFRTYIWGKIRLKESVPRDGLKEPGLGTEIARM